MNAICPKPFERLFTLEGLSPRCMREHYRLYEGYVRKHNELSAKLAGLHQAAKHVAGADSESLKVDLTYALGAIKNHELYFDILGGPAGGQPAMPTGVLAEAIKEGFFSLPQYVADLKQTAILGRGWAWTALDLDHGTLFNYSAAGNGIPVWNTIPILGIDLYGHAYFYDFGSNKMGYLEAVMQALDWHRIGERFAAAKSVAGATRPPAAG